MHPSLDLTTGRYVVIFKDERGEDPNTVGNTLTQAAGIRAADVVRPRDFADAAITGQILAEADAIHFPTLGVVVVAGADAAQAIAASFSDADSPIRRIEPEYYAFLSDPLSPEYLRGFRDASDFLCQRASSGLAGAEAEVSAVTFDDSPQFAWGLQATGVTTSRFTGQGVRVAVLDTGFDTSHPDYRGRAIQSRSFVRGATVQDEHGHGTHCVGTACGPLAPATGVRRYGVAGNAEIFVGRVFERTPAGFRAPTANVLAGIEWAAGNQCAVISMSLGTPVDQIIEQYATPTRRALRAGTVVVAAAGNNARRPDDPGFVEPPANADAVMAVAAVNRFVQIAPFSGRSSRTTGQGGVVNIAGPGVNVFSSFPLSLSRSTPAGYAFLDGTSMATPHVAGIVALWAEAQQLKGEALWARVSQAAKPLDLPSSDVGAGLVQAPRS